MWIIHSDTTAGSFMGRGGDNVTLVDVAMQRFVRYLLEHESGFSQWTETFFPFEGKRNILH